LALLFGRERMVSPITDWDFFEGSPGITLRKKYLGHKFAFSRGVPLQLNGIEKSQPIPPSP